MHERARYQIVDRSRVSVTITVHVHPTDSTYGHVRTMARAVKKGVDSVQGAQGVLYQVPETLPAEILEKIGAPPKDDTVPVISAAQLPEADGPSLASPRALAPPLPK